MTKGLEELELIKDNCVYARGMYQIERYVLMLKALYLDRRSK